MNKQGLRLSGLLTVVVAILIVAAYTLSQTGGASWFPAAVFVLVAVLAVAYVVVVLSPARRPLVALPEGGVGLSNSPVVAGLLVALLVAFFLVPVSLGVAWAGSGDRPITAAGPLVLLVVAAVGLVPVVIGLARGRYRLGGLAMTSEGVSYTSFVRGHMLTWEQVDEVVPHPTVARLELRVSQAPTATGRRVRAGERRVSTPAEQLNVPMGLLRTDAERLRRFIDFYRTHPRNRHELVDGTALTQGHEEARR